MSDAPLPAAYRALLEELRQADLLASTNNLLSWDQETGMPAAGGQLRAAQISLLSGLVHERRTHPKIGELLAACEADPELMEREDAAANLRESRRDYDRATRLPAALVREFAEVTTLAQQAWRRARERDDFAAFAPWLEKVVRLSHARAECLADATGGSLYDALLDEYEPGAREAEIDQVFGELRGRLAPLIADLTASGQPRCGPVQRGGVSIAAQAELNTAVLRALGFDLDAGRLDSSTHPFCQGIGAGDTRLTTRYREDDFTDSLSSALHEAGHGLYEQGLPKASRPGQPLSEAAGLGIHESQSRLWENQIGRSLEFSAWVLPLAREALGPALEGVTPDDLHCAQNRVRPTLIRVESDEATYNLHIMIRFDLERSLLSGDLRVPDLPAAWAERVRADLGLEVPDDRRGALQDIHWSMGAIGYFPTYTLGNLYAAQLWEAIGAEVPGLSGRVRRGDFAALLGWLRDRIHRHGRRFSASELCRRATGKPLSSRPFITYLEGKLRPLYGLA